VALAPNDFLSFETVPPVTVFVNGFVTAPGAKLMPSGSRVLQAVAQSGGLTVPLEQVVATIRRGDTVIPINLERAIIGNDSAADVALKTGDVLLLSEPQIIRVEVVGPVGKPGTFRLPPTATLFDALTQAGGLTPPVETVRINVMRRTADGGQVALKTDPKGLVQLRDASQNIRLRDGDIVAISEIQALNVYVSGETAAQGPIQIREQDGLAEVLARAGGPTKNAALTRVTVRRGDQTYQVDVSGAFREGAAPPNFTLRDGDFVVVPRNAARILVMGSVRVPGYLSIPEGGKLTVLEALTEAGGTVETARIKEVALLRRTDKGEVQRTVVPLDKIGQGRLKAGDTTLQPGDIVFVPQIQSKQSLLSQASQAMGFLNIFRAF
jgi:protein involved in polysaccharide export with SLBB domain